MFIKQGFQETKRMGHHARPGGFNKSQTFVHPESVYWNIMGGKFWLCRVTTAVSGIVFDELRVLTEDVAFQVPTVKVGELQ